MALSTQLISQFAKMANTNNSKKTTTSSTTVYGKTVVYNGQTYVQLDGSDLLTPVETTSAIKDGDRVTVKIENHTATVTGNLSDPSASSGTVTTMGNQISEFEIIIADKVSVAELEAEIARIDTLVADNVTIKETLTAAEADIENLEADNVTIKETLTAAEANINKLETEKISTTFAEATFATIENLEAANAEIRNLEATYGEFEELTTKNFEAVSADIDDLETEKLSAESAKLIYANIDFSNIGKAAIEKLFSDSGIIKDLIMSDGKVTGELIGVTIKGDLIEAETLKADRLIVKGSDGLYYALNVAAGVTTSEEVTEEELQNGLHGDVLVKKSVVAEKIAVDDLTAFEATIAGINMTLDETGLGMLYSLVKNSIDNTTEGFYFDSKGQMNIGNSDQYLKFYYDEESETYRLLVSADSIIFGGGKNVETELSDVKDTASTTTSKLSQLRSLLSQVVTDEDGNSLMVETPEAYTRTTETMDAVEGVLLDNATTTDGDQVYVFDGEYYAVVDSVYYKVTYTPGTCTFNISDLENAINLANSSLSSLSGQMDSTVSTVTAIQQAVDDFGLIGGYIYIDEEFDIGDGDTAPAIVLGESDSEFKVVITNKQIAFMEGSAVPAYISGQTLIAQKVEVKQELKQGGFSWVTHDGNLGLVWTGATTAAITYDVYFTDYEISDTSGVAKIGYPLDVTVVVRPYEEASMATGTIECTVYHTDTINGGYGNIDKGCTITSDFEYSDSLGTWVCTFHIYIPVVSRDLSVEIIYI